MPFEFKTTLWILVSFLLSLTIPPQLFAAGPAPVDLLTTAHFAILSGAGITTTGGGIINGDVGAYPIAGSAIGVPCPQVNGIIYARDATGPACAVIADGLLLAAKNDLTTACNDAAGRTPIPSGPNLNPGLIPGSGNIGGMVLAPGLYKFTTTALITGADVTLLGGADDVWIFQCAQDLQLGSGISVILAGGAQAKNVFWQVGSSAVLGTFSSFKGTILASQAITMDTSSTTEGRLLAFSAGVVFNGNGAALPTAPEIGVQQPPGTNLVDGLSTNNFGSVNVGTNSSLIFTITNSGDADLTGLSIIVDGVDSAMFTVTTNPAVSVGTNGSTIFTVRFAPASSGLKTAALHIANNDTDEDPFDIILTGTGTGSNSVPEIVVEQPPGTNIVDGLSSRDFGLILVGNNSSLTFTIRNSGSTNLTGLGITIDGVDSAMFTVTTNPAVSLGTNGSTTFMIQFAPASSGLKTAVLHIANNDSDENPFDITLTGTGTTVAAPEIGVRQPASSNLVDGVSVRNFGSVAVGANTNLTFTITNSGTANLSVIGFSIDGLDSGSFSLASFPASPISPNGSTTFIIQFAPDSAGFKTAALHIQNNDSDENPFDVTIIGTGGGLITNGVPEIAVEQPAGTNLIDGVSNRDFGSVSVGNTTNLTFTIRNLGTTNLTGLNISIDGVNAAQFTVIASPVAPVGPNGSTTFTVQFAPVSTGPKSAALHIANNDSDENPFDITLTGTGIVAPTNAAPEIGVEQPTGTNLIDGVSTRDFGSVSVGTNALLAFTIRNSGTTNLTGLVITIDGLDAAMFSIVTNPVTTLGPGSNTIFTIRFTPTSAGVKSAVLHIANNDSNESPFDINLVGTGTGGIPVASTNAVVTSISPITLNPQTGLFEQTVRVTNVGAEPVESVRLLILNLPGNVQVYNASGSTNGTPYVQYNLPLAPTAFVDFRIEYYRANRQAFSSPTFVVQSTTAGTVVVNGTIFPIDRFVALEDGRFLLEFSATPGARYAVQYSSDMQDWKTAAPIITAPANRVQWYDDGPPKTESKPSSVGSRFYRIMLLP